MAPGPEAMEIVDILVTEVPKSNGRCNFFFFFDTLK